MEPLISVIVPVYKCEKYLDKCFESLTNQTYKNVEILLIDDGSPGDAPKICDEWAEKDSRITVFHKANGGPSDARNFGIENSKGEYIAMIDCDDYISLKFIEVMYRAISENDAEIAVCGFKKVLDSNADINESIVYDNIVKTVFGGIEMMRNFYNVLNDAAVIIWNKLYKRSVFDSIKYPTDIINEDEAVIHQIYYNTSKVVFVDAVLNYYRMTPGSLMRSEYNIHSLDSLRAKRIRLDFFKEKALDDLFGIQSLFYCLEAMQHYSKIKSVLHGKNTEAGFSVDTLKMLYSQFNKYYPYAKGGTRNQRIMLRLAKISPNLYILANNFT